MHQPPRNKLKICPKMKSVIKITNEHVWLGCLAVGPLMAYGAIYNPAFSVLAVVFIIIGIKGTLYHIY